MVRRAEELALKDVQVRPFILAETLRNNRMFVFPELEQLFYRSTAVI